MRHIRPKLSVSPLEESFDAAVNKWKHRKHAPQNQNYIRGRAFEYAGIAAFRKRGFVCFRSFGSVGAADYLAYRHGICYLVQCKWSAMLTTDPRGHDLSKLISLAHDVGATAVFQGVGKPKSHTRMLFWAYVNQAPVGWTEQYDWSEFNPFDVKQVKLNQERLYRRRAHR